MKFYESTRDLIDGLVDFHYRASSLFEQALTRDQDDAVIVTINYLFEYHLKLQEDLAGFGDDLGEGETDTDVTLGFSLEDEDAPQAYVESLVIDDNMAFEKVAKLARDMGDYVVTLLDDAAGEVLSPEAITVLAGILDIEREEHKRLLMAVSALRDNS